MGRYVFKLPDIGEGIAEAEIVAWHVKLGDHVEEDSRLADVMTGKATVEMESPVTGTIVEVAGEVGATVAIGSPLVVIEVEGYEASGHDAAPPVAAPSSAQVVEDVVSPAEDNAGDVAPRPVKAQPEAKAVAARASRALSSSGHALASPAVRKRAQALGVDLATVPHGADGIVRHEDLDAFLLAGRAAPATAASAPSPAASSEAKPAKAEVPPMEDLPGVAEKIKVIGLRRRIAENMAASKRSIPHFTYVDECDVTDLEALRAELNDIRGTRPKLTLLPFFITAVCKSLPRFPMINARYDDAAGVVTRYASVHLGMATQTDNGLMVPVIRDAQDKSVWNLAAEIARLAEAARDGSAKPEELAGSTLTVTSLGPLGGIATTPVINRPEVAIIGPNRIIERPVFVTDENGVERLEKRKLMNISISCDHRVVDGWDAANFIQDLKRGLEAPLAMMAS